jgi:transcription-repair coupling factor (superfamily II helicase)
MQSLFTRLRQQEPIRLDLTGLAGGSSSLLLARLGEQLDRPVCCIVPSDEQLASLARDTALFTDIPILLYPSFEIPPYADLSPDPATTATRLATLYRLQESDQAALVLASAEAILRRVLPASILNNSCELVISGEETDREALIDHLSRTGYEPCDLVRRPGDMAIRGGIIDIFPPSLSGDGLPLRLDFFGDTVESIRSFDPATQRSKKEHAEAVLLPASDMLFAGTSRQSWHNKLQAMVPDRDWSEEACEALVSRLATGTPFPGCEFYLPLLYAEAGGVETFFDYLPDNALIATLDPDSCRQKTALIRERIEANFHEAQSAGKPVLPAGHLFLSEEEQAGYEKKHSQLHLRPLPDPDGSAETIHLNCGDHSLLVQEIELQRQKRGLLAPLADRLLAWSSSGHSCVIACKSERQQEHVAEILAGYGLETGHITQPITSFPAADNTVLLVNHPLSRGFDLAD